MSTIERFTSVPINKALRFKLVSRSASDAELRMPVQEWFAQEGNVVQGGIISAFADTAAVYALYPDLDEGTKMTSVEFKINFLRAARMDAGELAARSHVVRKGRTIAVCAVDVLQRGETIATGLFTYCFAAAGCAARTTRDSRANRARD